MDQNKELELLLLEQEVRNRQAGTTKTEDTPSTGAAIAQGLEKGGTLGLKDRISGVIQGALGTKFGDMFVPEGGQNPYKDQSFQQNYEQGKQDSAADYAKAQDAHPMATFAGGLVGSIPSAIVAGPSLAGGAALGGIVGAASQDSDKPSDLLKGALTGGAVGAAGYGIAKGLGAARNALQVATPTVDLGRTAAKALTGLSDSAMPNSLSDALSSTIPPVNHSSFLTDLGKGSAAGFLGLGPATGPVFAMSRSDIAKQAAQKGLDAISPLLRTTDKAVQTGAEFIGPDGFLSNLSAPIQKTITDAASQGPRQLAITHFLLGNTNADYQQATSQQTTDKSDKKDEPIPIKSNLSKPTTGELMDLGRITKG